ncbi:uncharacterized protein N7459_000302 [Penicillium hispanicum]|uniref:uncharacterized protein n=1 Tax=Penicillium hispanicum TaxID=1080232 RepID=UPI002542293F|nr:uncharacterized protein N7459_000302 [Penicillium hispanicum]KAJ5594094.1 hypothetical protein N7459_000302 [Penicillium hispanicum]
MDMNRPHIGSGDGLERRHSEGCVPHQHDMPISPKQATNLEIPHPHFAVIYLDHNGKLQVEASPSIAGCGGAIFTPDVADRFMEMATPNPQASLPFTPIAGQHQTPPSPWGIQPGAGWMPTGQARPAELIPCEWQSHQSRRKRRDLKRSGMVRPRPKSPSPPPTPPPGRTVLRIGNRDLLRRYYEKAFEDFQQLNCRAIAKSYIKLVEPRKQVHYPYNGRKVIAGVSQRVDPERTKPGWWPADVLHREPDHLLKRDRLHLLVHILCDLKDSHGVTADKLREAGQDVRRQITPANRLQVLDEIYFVRQTEERYLNGEIDANTLIQVTQTQLPEATCQEDELTANIHTAPLSAVHGEHDGHDLDDAQSQSLDDSDPLTLQGHQNVPLSPATSDSSGPHSPATVFNPYPVGMPAAVMPHDSSASKAMPTDPNYMAGYFTQPFVPTEKPSSYWPNVPPMPPQQFLMEESSAHQRRQSDVVVAESMASTPFADELDNPFDDFDHDDFYSPPASPGKLSRTGSFSNSSSYQEDWETFPPLDKLTIFDLLDNIQVTQRLERWQHAINMQREKVRKQREKLRSTGMNAKERVVGEWKRRVPTADEQLDKYRRRMKLGVERLGKQWNKTATVTLREKISFIAGVLNIFISGYLIGACPEYFYIWFTAQLVYFMPIRYYTYHAKGYHYFLADLCYFVNLLNMLSLWAFPGSKRLFISTYCLTFGNNAAAIAMWRNSMVFHSMDKVVSLFIHIMPPVTLHCLVHLTPVEMLKERFPAIYAIKYSQAGDPEHYGLGAMMIWATVPYIVWQLAYHFLITVRRADKIAAGRPTSFTWLRKSYSKAWIGRFVLSLPEALQEPVFMLIQYGFALSTMIPCPIWFWSRWASGIYITALFVWSIHNGATYYIDVFGKRFQKELEQLKKDVARWQTSPEGANSPLIFPDTPGTPAADARHAPVPMEKRNSLDRIPLLDPSATVSTSIAVPQAPPATESIVRERA